jgi:hypothetical protein
MLRASLLTWCKQTGMENGQPGNGTGPGDDDRSSNVGVIAGATVGGVAGVLIIVAGAWYFLRRRGSSVGEMKDETKGETDHLQQYNEASAPYYKPSPYSNYSSTPYTHAPYSQSPYAQPQYGQPQYPQPPYQNSAPQELPNTTVVRHELPGQSRRSELDS